MYGTSWYRRLQTQESLIENHCRLELLHNTKTKRFGFLMLLWLLSHLLLGIFASCLVFSHRVFLKQFLEALRLAQGQEIWYKAMHEESSKSCLKSLRLILSLVTCFYSLKWNHVFDFGGFLGLEIEAGVVTDAELIEEAPATINLRLG